MKKTIKILIMTTVLMLMFGAINAFAADDIGVYVDGKAIEFDVAPQIINDRTMIPFRYVANAFDAEVDYKEEADGRKIVTAVQGNKALILTIGNTDAVLVEKGVETVIAFDVAPVIVEGRTLVPVRLIGEAFGCSVGWDNENRDVIIIDIESGVTADLKAQCPEFFDEVLSVDLRKIQGYYHMNIGVTADMKVEAFTFDVTFDVSADDDAVMFSIPADNEQVDIICTTDALYMNSPDTMGLWVKLSYNEIDPEFKFDPADLVIDSSFGPKNYADSLMANGATTDTFNTYIESLEAMIEQAKAGNLIVKTDGDVKTVSYVCEFPIYDGSTSKIKLSYAYRNDILTMAEYNVTNNGSSEPALNLYIEREDAAEAFDIKAPADDVVVSMEELMAMQSNQ